MPIESPAQLQIKGRSAYVTNLHESAEFVRWSPDGTHYAVGLGRRVDLYSVATAAVILKVINISITVETIETVLLGNRLNLFKG